MPTFTEIVELYAGSELTTAVNRMLHDMKMEFLLEEGCDEEAPREANKYRNRDKGPFREKSLFGLKEVVLMSDYELSTLTWPHAILLMHIVEDEAYPLLHWKLSNCRAAAWRGPPDTVDFPSGYSEWVATRDQRFLEARGRAYSDK